MRYRCSDFFLFNCVCGIVYLCDIKRIDWLLVVLIELCNILLYLGMWKMKFERKYDSFSLMVFKVFKVILCF